MSTTFSGKRLAMALVGFYVITASALYVGTLAHEYSHYVAHEGWEPAPIKFYATPDAAREALVFVEPVDQGGKTYRVENVQETTIVLYNDALLYALTLNFLPVSMYDTGSLGATYLHADEAATSQMIAGGKDGHWTAVMGAPLMVAIGMLVVLTGLMIWKPNLGMRALVVAYAAELGNNAHHATDIGMNGAVYSVIAEVLFAIALVAAVALSPAYKTLLRGRPSRPTGPPPVPLPDTRGPQGVPMATRVPPPNVAPIPAGQLPFQRTAGGPAARRRYPGYEAQSST